MSLPPINLDKSTYQMAANSSPTDAGQKAVKDDGTRVVQDMQSYQELQQGYADIANGNSTSEAAQKAAAAGPQDQVMNTAANALGADQKQFWGDKVTSDQAWKTWAGQTSSPGLASASQTLESDQNALQQFSGSATSAQMPANKQVILNSVVTAFAKEMSSSGTAADADDFVNKFEQGFQQFCNSTGQSRTDPAAFHDYNVALQTTAQTANFPAVAQQALQKWDTSDIQAKVNAALTASSSTPAPATITTPAATTTPAAATTPATTTTAADGTQALTNLPAAVTTALSDASAGPGKMTQTDYASALDYLRTLPAAQQNTLVSQFNKAQAGAGDALKTGLSHLSAPGMFNDPQNVALHDSPNIQAVQKSNPTLFADYNAVLAAPGGALKATEPQWDKLVADMKTAQPAEQNAIYDALNTRSPHMAGGQGLGQLLATDVKSTGAPANLPSTAIANAAVQGAALQAGAPAAATQALTDAKAGPGKVTQADYVAALTWMSTLPTDQQQTAADAFNTAQAGVGDSLKAGLQALPTSGNDPQTAALLNSPKILAMQKSNPTLYADYKAITATNGVQNISAAQWQKLVTDMQGANGTDKDAVYDALNTSNPNVEGGNSLGALLQADVGSAAAPTHLPNDAINNQTSTAGTFSSTGPSAGASTNPLVADAYAAIQTPQSPDQTNINALMEGQQVWQQKGDASGRNAAFSEVANTLFQLDPSVGGPQSNGDQFNAILSHLDPKLQKAYTDFAAKQKQTISYDAPNKQWQSIDGSSNSNPKPFHDVGSDWTAASKTLDDGRSFRDQANGWMQDNSGNSSYV